MIRVFRSGRYALVFTRNLALLQKEYFILQGFQNPFLYAIFATDLEIQTAS